MRSSAARADLLIGRIMPERPDLAALLVPLGRTMANAEVPVLREHGLTMWRARLIALTAGGRQLRGAARVAIQLNEARLLGRLPATERQLFLATLQRLAREASDAFD